jgi:hypothetical protein
MGQRASSVRRGRTAVAALAGLLLFALIAPAARAVAPAELPATFYGVLPQTERPQEDYLAMKRGGVDSVRFPIPWDAVERSPGQYDFSLIDRYVERTARAGLEAFPAVNATPPFYGEDFRTLPVQTSEQKAAWEAFLRAIVDRYGPRGSFWAARPDLPRRPIRIYQIWNEANFVFFTEQRSPTQYAELVKISHGAIKGRDPGARIVLSGLFAHPKRSQGWEATAFLNRLYKVRGIKARFDGVALHPYATDASELGPDIRAMRRVMRRNGDARTAFYLTEIGWGDARDTAFEKGPRGQVRELSQSFEIVRRMQRSARIKRVFWFSWEDLRNSCNFCESTGLWTENAARPKAAWFRFRAYAGCFGRSATILGTRGRDRLVGTRGSDVIVSEHGNDRIIGRGGRDFVCAGPGKDRITAGGGRDRIAGGHGNDRVFLRGGRDSAWGGTGADLLGGSHGPDTVLGGSGRDRLLGAAGNDRLFGQAGNDVLIGARGNDFLRGNRGRDRLVPGNGSDRLRQ